MILALGSYKKLDDGIVADSATKEARSYLGASLLGTECDRQLWYEYKFPKPVTDAKLQRIFDIGNAIEVLVIGWLKKSGFEVVEKDENGNQFGFEDEMIAGHCDGAIRGLPESSEWHLLEIKSAKNSSFNSYKEFGVKAQNPRYFYQMQIYMLKLGLKRAMFLMVNKDTAEIYIERVEFEKELAENALLRAKEIAKSEQLPDRKWNKSSYFKCKICNYNKECWGL